MQRLLALAAAKGFKAEIFCNKEKSLKISKVDGVCSSVPAYIHSGISIRIIKEGKIGTAYTLNLKDREALLENAILSMEAGIEAGFFFLSVISLYRKLPVVCIKIYFKTFVLVYFCSHLNSLLHSSRLRPYRF